MDLKQAFIQGLSRGASLFAPVSPQGHEALLGMDAAPLLLSAALSLCALLVLLIVYHKRAGIMLRHPLRSDLKWMILSAVPLYAAGWYVNHYMPLNVPESALGVCFLGTCVLLLLADAAQVMREHKHKRVNVFDALAMGLMQTIALIPGLSGLSGSILGGSCTGLNRRRAVDFAFLMYIPLMLGRLSWNLYSLFAGAQQPVGTLLSEAVAQLGGAAPFAVCVGVFAAAALLMVSITRLLAKKLNLRIYAIYTGVLGLYLIARQLLF